MPQIEPKLSLPALRIAAGAGACAAPQLLQPLLGLPMQDNHAAVFMARLFGARDIVFGIGTLAAGPAGKPLWFKLGLACDAADATAALLSYRAGMSKRAMLFSTITALSAFGLGIAALTGE